MKIREKNIETFVCVVLVAYLVVRLFAPPLIFKNKMTIGKIKFCSQTESPKFESICKSAMEEIRANTFYNPKKRIAVYFCDK